MRLTRWRLIVEECVEQGVVVLRRDRLGGPDPYRSIICSSKRTSGWPARRASCSAVAAIAVACLWLLPQGLRAQDAPGGVSNGLSVWYEASHGFSGGASPTWECRAPASC